MRGTAKNEYLNALQAYYDAQKASEAAYQVLLEYYERYLWRL